MFARVGTLGLNCPGDPGCPGNPVVLPGTQAVVTVTDTGESVVTDTGTGASFFSGGSLLSQLGGTGTAVVAGGAFLLLLLLTRRR